MKIVPALGDTLYQFIDLMDGHGDDAMRVMRCRVIKVWKDYLFIATVRRNGELGSQRKVPITAVLDRYALTPGEAVLLEIDRLNMEAEQARKRSASLLKQAGRYLQFMQREKL